MNVAVIGKEKFRYVLFVSSMSREGVTTVSRMPNASSPGMESAGISMMPGGASNDRPPLARAATLALLSGVNRL